MRQKRKALKALVTIYSHVNFYPPSLNAIDGITGIFKNIDVLVLPFAENGTHHKREINFRESGKNISVRSYEQKGNLYKAYVFVNYSFYFALLLLVRRPKLIVIYDSLALLSYRMVKFLKPKKAIVWYHNHDVLAEEEVAKGTMNYFALLSEKKAMKYLDIFSLPTFERLKYFNLNEFQGKLFFLPNYPTLNYVKQWEFDSKIIEEEVVILFQGSIGRGHGIENIIPLLKKPLYGKRLKLILKGIIREDYNRELITLVDSYGIEAGRFEIHGFTEYSELKELTLRCHIGIAIFTKDDSMNSTLGTASNKIYEYAACGLPVLYLDTDYWNGHLGKYDWAFAVDLSEESFSRAIKTILTKYDFYSSAAYGDYKSHLHFEKHFKSITDDIAITCFNNLYV